MNTGFAEIKTITLRRWGGMLLIAVAISLGAYSICRSLILDFPSKEIFGAFLSMSFIFAALWAMKGIGVDLKAELRHYNETVPRSLKSAFKYLLGLLVLGALLSLVVIVADILLTKFNLLPQDSFGRTLIPEPSEQNNYISTNLINAPIRLFLFFIVSCLLAPIGEELVFRRLLFSSLRKNHSMSASLLVSSFIFGVFHGGSWFVALGKGLVFGYGYEKTMDIQAIIFLHMLVNILALGIGFLFYLS